MAYTVPAAFDQFYNAINLAGDHRNTANARRDRLVSLLSNAFDVLEAFGTGSIPKLTALKGHADLDIMVVLHYGKHIKGRTPAQVLQDVRDALGEYRTNVRKNGQAVTLYYKTWPHVDVVPVSRTTSEGGQTLHYNVPDIHSGTWIKSTPKRHASAIEQKATECGAAFRRIVKMIKWWNLSHSAYLQSYHIEVLALNVLEGPLNDMPWDVFQFFVNARRLLEGPLYHDVGYVDEYLSYVSRQEVLKRLDTAIDLARAAWYNTYLPQANHREAIRLWRRVFGDKFPEYG